MPLLEYEGICLGREGICVDSLSFLISRFGVEDVEVSKKLLLGRFSFELVRSLPCNRLNAGSIL